MTPEEREANLAERLGASQSALAKAVLRARDAHGELAARVGRIEERQADAEERTADMADVQATMAETLARLEREKEGDQHLWVTVADLANRVTALEREVEVPPDAWLSIPGTGLKRCPRCGASALEGEASCPGCGTEPSDDTTWRDTPEPPQTAAERRTGEKLLDMVRPGWRERLAAARAEPQMTASPTNTQKASAGEGEDALVNELRASAAVPIPDDLDATVRHLLQVIQRLMGQAADRLASLRSVPAEPGTRADAATPPLHEIREHEVICCCGDHLRPSGALPVEGEV